MSLTGDYDYQVIRLNNKLRMMTIIINKRMRTQRASNQELRPDSRHASSQSSPKRNDQINDRVDK